jgi:predicted membrane protein (TIGR00267 family)
MTTRPPERAARIPSSELIHHARIDPHRHGSKLSDVILGGQDGLVNVLGVILGVAASTGSTRVVIAAALAATFAESISMAAVAYTSRVATGDLYESERARELRHVHSVPALERGEIRAIFAAKGFDGELLDRVVATITSNDDVWVSEMMAAEHGLARVDRRTSLRSALVVGVASILGSLVPLVPFLFLPATTGCAVSVVAAATTLFAAGAYKARVTIGTPWKAGAELALIGIASAFVGYVVGALLRVPGA